MDNYESEMKDINSNVNKEINNYIWLYSFNKNWRE